MRRSLLGCVYMHVRSWLSHTSALLLMLLIIGVVNGRMEHKHRNPLFNDTPTNLTYYRGDRAILQCSVKNLGTKQVIWKRTDVEHALTVGEFVFVDDPDIDVDNLPHRDEWNLIIRNVQPRHQGIYECQISTKEDLRRYVQLNVIDSPVPRKQGIVITGKDFVEKGEKIVLTCNATGEFFPPEDIDWFKDGSKVKQNQNRGISISKFRISETKTLHSKLEIDHSDMVDSGNYICRSSDIDITSKPVMVLNGKQKPPPSKQERYQTGEEFYLGSAKRSRKKILIDKNGRWKDNAETNPNKRDNPDDAGSSASKSSSRAPGVSIGSVILIIAVLLTLTNTLDIH